MYSFKRRIGYSETDASLHLSYFALVNLFQDAAIFEGQNQSMSIEELYENNEAWLLGSWQICINRRPFLNEEVEVSTIPYEFKGFLGYRNFILKTVTGEVLAVAYSIWSLIDIESLKPIRVSEEIKARYDVGDKLDMDYKPRRINLLGEGKEQEKVSIRKGQIDSNKHVNNAEYVNLALEYLEEGKELKEIRVEYKNAAHLESTIIPRTYMAANSLQVELSGDEGVYAIVEMSF